MSNYQNKMVIFTEFTPFTVISPFLPAVCRQTVETHITQPILQHELNKHLSTLDYSLQNGGNVRAAQK